MCIRATSLKRGTTLRLRRVQTRKTKLSFKNCKVSISSGKMLLFAFWGTLVSLSPENHLADSSVTKVKSRYLPVSPGEKLKSPIAWKPVFHTGKRVCSAWSRKWSWVDVPHPSLQLCLLSTGRVRMFLSALGWRKVPFSLDLGVGKSSWGASACWGRSEKLFRKRLAAEGT